ncbi:DUF488 domain-containing protein [Enemella sp. A6]|uniref:DUF488 domain-containing protein n=1 Tax=Enemella sp. A6 TaxID=3440152 RepID=UPI003EB7DFA6
MPDQPTTPDSTDETAPTIWTIGHWVCPQGDFVHTLRAEDIETVVDVRSHPGSRRSPQFGADALRTWLPEAGLDYLHLPELGGRRAKQHEVQPEINAGWQNTSFKNYADYTLTEAYREGLHRLQELAAHRNVVIMCGEPMPWRCHRSLIANSLTARGWTVWHLSTTAAPRRHVLGAWGAEPVVNEDGTITYPPEQQSART